MVSAEVLVKVVVAAKVLVLEVPFKSIAPTALMLPGKVFAPVPCKASELIAALSPIIPPNEIVPDPLLTISAWAPLILDVAPLKEIDLSVEVSVIWFVAKVIGPVYVCVPAPELMLLANVKPTVPLKAKLPVVVIPTVVTVPTV